MSALTSSTSIVDPVGYLGLDRVFAGDMTGNVVVLGMGLAGAISRVMSTADHATTPGAERQQR